MIYHDIETGTIRLSAVGKNAFIVKGNKKTRIPSCEVETGLIEEFQKTNDRTKLEKFRADYPKFTEDSTVVCGAKTIVSISSSYNKGKENPVDDWKSRASKNVFMGPNSELQVSGLEKWDKADNKEKKRWHGELIRNIELKKGFFEVSYSHTEDILVTPTALVKFNFDGTGFFDVYGDILYSSPIASTSVGAGGVEYTNKASKRSFTAKSPTFEEIIVTRGAIYRKGLTKMDDIFANAVQLNLFFQSGLTKAIPSMDEKTVAEQYKNMPKTMEQALGGLEMYKQMSPDDIVRLMKVAEAKGGTKITPEMMEQMKAMPDMLKMMDKEGMLNQMKKGIAMSKGFVSGLGDKGAERLAGAQKEALEMLKKPKTPATEGTDVEKMLDAPRKYKPLTDAVKVA